MQDADVQHNSEFDEPHGDEAKEDAGVRFTESVDSSRVSDATVGLRAEDLSAAITPFKLNWIFGVDTSVRVLNVSIQNRPLVFYAATHAGVLYNYGSKEMQLLEGHANKISGIAVDGSGKWLVTADKGTDSVIIIWDSEECTPVNTIFDVHPKHGSAAVAISPNAKYLVSLGYEEEPHFCFWLWTLGNNKPDDEYVVDPEGKGHVKRIRFNPDIQEQIMVTFQKQVMFTAWNPDRQKLLPPIFPAIKNRKKFGFLTDCTYIEGTSRCVVSTCHGYLLIFNNTVYTTPYHKEEVSNEKLFVSAIRVSTVALLCVESVDGLITVGDDNGLIKFYDNMIRLLFWCQNFKLDPILSIGFNLVPRKYKVKDATDFDNDSQILIKGSLQECEERAEKYERLYAQLVPSDYTIQRIPFIVRNFIVATSDGRIAKIDYMNNIADFLFRKCESTVSSIDVHDEEPYIVIGYTNGSVAVFDHNTHEQVSCVSLTCCNRDLDAEYEICGVSTLKYSPQGLHLACGMNDGTLWFLDPISLIARASQPFRITKAATLKMVFSLDSVYFSYYDASYTLAIMKYSGSQSSWEYLGKLRPHYKDINDILFTNYFPSRLFTIGEDRLLIEYDLERSGGGDIEVLTRERIEQTAIPKTFTHYLAETDSDRYFLIVDDQFKFKKMHDNSLMIRSVILAPAYGCYKNYLIRQMIIHPKHKERYMIFASDRHIGIHAVPPDGNPFKFVGSVGHPIRLRGFCISNDGKYLFTYGEDDACVLQWEINTSSVDVMTKLGGLELEPYYCLLEGGIHGWLFREMQDLFYYMQILHQGENTVLPRTVNDYIPVSELPDLMRACGFYPSEYDIETMIVDIKYREFDKTKTINDQISFLDFVKLYINHRPVYGIYTKDLQESFDTFCMAGEGYELNSITRSSFVQLLCERGEAFTMSKVRTCLAILMHTGDEGEEGTSKDVTFLPEEFQFNTFLETLLGVDLQRQTLEKNVRGDAD